MRIVFLLSSLVFAACTVGEVGTSNNNVPDGGTKPGTDGGATGNGCVDLLVPAGDAHIHTAGGTSNAGLNCMGAGCHLNNNLGAGASGYQFAGTLYKAGTTPLAPYAGSTIQIKVAGTAPLTAVTDKGGNFFFPAGSLPGNFTATTDATACPTVTPMVTNLVSGGGAGANSCNLCHTAGAGAQAPPITL